MHESEQARLLEKIGSLSANVEMLTDGVQELKADTKDLSKQVSELKTKVTLHASFFGFIGSVVTMSTTGLFKKLLGG